MAVFLKFPLAYFSGFGSGFGSVYLTAVVDWAIRKVLAAKVVVKLGTCHAVEVLQEAIARHGRRS